MQEYGSAPNVDGQHTMSARYELACEGSPKLSIVSSEAQSGSSIETTAISKSAVLSGLLGSTQQDLVLPVSTLGLQQWASWALAPSSSSNCFSALSEGLQVCVKWRLCEMSVV